MQRTERSAAPDLSFRGKGRSVDSAMRNPSDLRFRRLLLGFGVALLGQTLVGCAAQGPTGGTPPPGPPNNSLPFDRGVNLANALEAPSEGDWGLTIQKRYIDVIADAGFQTVRLPVKWSGHADAQVPYTLDPTFLARVDEVVGWILDRDLNVVLDMHNDDAMVTQPASEEARWLAIWQQLAEHYQAAPATLAFELLNEPNSALDDAHWNPMIRKTLAVIRPTNPERWVVVGPTAWNRIAALPGLSLPDDDHLVVTVHFYDPFDFTHQGAEWVSPSPPVGRTWTGTRLTRRAGWEDWSWDTDVTYDDSLTLTFRAGWAGFYLHSVQPVSGYQTLALRTSRAVDLLITCGAQDGGTPVTTQAGREARVPLSDCGGTQGVPRIIVQNGTGKPQAAFDLQLLELRGPSGTLPLLVTEADAITTAFDQVQSWAEANGNPPVLLGEFGAYGTADMPSRVRWTRAVREAAEAHGFGWAYWEFGAGFGVYDTAASRWRNDLLGALLDR